MSTIVAERETHPTVPAVGDVLGRRFEIRGVLGEGGMGCVFAAYDRRRGEPVALKLIVPRYLGRPEREERFLRELELGRRANRHAHLVEMLDGGRLEDSNRPFLTMSPVEGKDLSHRLALGPLPPHLAARFARQIAGAIRALHRQDVVHRDITPMNVLIDGDNAVLIDLSHAGDSAAPQRVVGHERRLTRENEVPGTHQYMPPEQARAEPAQPAMDIYAFGVTLAHMLCGLALDQYSREAALALQREGRLPPPRVDTRIHTTVPSALARLVEACTASPAKARPAIDDVVQELDEVLASMVMPAAISEPAWVRPAPPVAEGSPARRAPRGRTVASPAANVSPAPKPVPVQAVPQDPQPIARSDKRRLVLLLAALVALLALGLAAWWWKATGTAAAPQVDENQDLPQAEAVRSAAGGETSADAPAIEQPPPAEEPAAVEDPPSQESADVPEEREPETLPPPKQKRRPKRASVNKAKRPAPPAAETNDDLQPSDTPECVAHRQDAEQAAASARWAEVATLARRRECWSAQSQRKHLRVRALFETQAWSACVAEGSGSSEPKIKQWVKLCQRHVD